MNPDSGANLTGMQGLFEMPGTVNLLLAPLSVDELEGILRQCPPCALIPPSGSTIWLDLAERTTIKRWLDTIRKQVDKDIAQPMPVLSEDMYREFYTKGQRLSFENAYFERRRIIGRIAMCALFDRVPDRWLVHLFERVQEILNEFSWALPANINSPSGQDPCRIDLFAAETCHMMADLHSLFGERMPAPLRDTLIARLNHQFFENYLQRHDDFWWTKSTNNWNGVCHQGVLGAALALEADPNRLARMLFIAKQYLPIFLSGFKKDGGYGEGPGYWQYGFGWFAMLNEQLETRTRNRLSLFENQPGLAEIARFGPRLALENFQFVNFGDSPRAGALNPSLLDYLGERLDDDSLRAHALRNYARLSKTGLNLNNQRTDLFYLTRLFLRLPPSPLADAPLPMQDVYFRDLGTLVTRFQDVNGHLWEFAAKAGHNAEHHNHNDCGTFLLNINGIPLVTEIGQPEYTKDFFRENRYQYLAARTIGHSLPIVNGQEQSAGTQYIAKVLSHEMTEDHVEFSIDLTECYPKMASIGDLVRSFYLDKKKARLRVKEFYELGNQHSYETALIADGEINIRDGYAELNDGGVTLIIRPFDATELSNVEELEYRDVTGIPRKVHRLIMTPSRLDEQKYIGYEIEIAPGPKA